MKNTAPFSATLTTEQPLAGDPYISWPHSMQIVATSCEVNHRLSLTYGEIELSLHAHGGSDFGDGKVSIRNLSEETIASAVVDWIARRYSRYSDAADHAKQLEMLERVEGATAAARQQIEDALKPAAV